MNLYIRFGELPLHEKSGIYNWAEQKIVGFEDGVSVYNCCYINNQWKILLPNVLKHTTLDTLYGFIYDKKPAYIVSGNEVGKGSDNEPLIRNCKVICELPANYFYIDIPEDNQTIQTTTL